MNKRGKDGSAKANIESRQGEMVWGVVYGIAKSDIDRLDKYESLGRGYRADYLDVVTPDKKTISA
ncbi:MAG: gamma-glutamylcyclotransferase, partial [Phycisphaerae bacterium]|nr:gamma-glutamylcyclotransferase [Phycisphaerae bacterium]